MAEQLKRYDIFVALFGTILSIADPITDILTLVEFYRADHKTWFGVGLTFVVLPSFFFVFVTCSYNAARPDDCASVLGCSPLLPAWLKMRTLHYYLKKKEKLRQGNTTGQMDAELRILLSSSKFAALVEAALEAAPQFIIQLYAMVVQQESVTIVQMVSLPVSFLSLAWASTVSDEWIHSDQGDLDFSAEDTVPNFVTHLFILSSRLFAVALFTVSYKWWVISVLIFHCTVITISAVWLGRQSLQKDSAIVLAFSCCSHWLRDDLSAIIKDHEDKHLSIRRMQLISNVLFVIENIIMILLFYFSHFPHTWYSLPVTICVCLFAVLGVVMRLTHFHFLEKESDGRSNNTDQVQQPEGQINSVAEVEA